MHSTDNYFALFHQVSKLIELTPAEYLKGRDIVHYKTYPRLSKIKLSEEKIHSVKLFDVLSGRKSSRNFKRSPITKQELAVLLKYSCGITSGSGKKSYRRAQPSAGALFPIEAYPLVFRAAEGLPEGLYHYNVKENSLDALWIRSFDKNNMNALFTFPWVKDASIALFLTAIFPRNKLKYGERGYRYTLLEAGHIGQNAYLISEALGLKCVAMGGTRDQEVEKLIDIDGVTESLVYTLIIGK